MTAPILDPATGLSIAAARDGTLLYDPERPKLKKRPLKAYRHFRNLMADKEDTEQVFHIFDALPSSAFVTQMENFALSEEGERVRQMEPALVPILDDHETLRKMPAGSVAHAYCDFMEAEGLSAAGLVAESEKTWAHRAQYDDLVAWYGNRRRDTHDLLHILTGYGRDALGEQCVLAFTHGQNGGPANLFIAYLGALELKRTVKSKAPVLRALREAQVKGRGRPRLTDRAVTEVLAMPLGEVREKLGIVDPRWYKECHRVWQDAGRDPYDLLAEGAAAA